MDPSMRSFHPFAIADWSSGAYVSEKQTSTADHSSPVVPQSTDDHDDEIYFGPKVFALLIGIDKYQSPGVSNLSGCVNDCKDVEAWLKEFFGSAYINMLFNEAATAQAIMNAVRAFASDRRIDRDDLILVYYAGHGGQIAPLEEWNLGSKRDIQMRIPYDFDWQGRNHILDRDFSRLISNVAEEKGENIVVILDSCHSASGTRDRDVEGTARCIQVPVNYAKTAFLSKADFTSGEANATRAASATPMNHTLLAACREDLKAREMRGDNGETRGVFTVNLFRRLRDKAARSWTYEEAILSLGTMSQQYPHCDGIHKDRYLFCTERKDRIFNLIERGSAYQLKAGLCRDVQKQDQFFLFSEPDFSSRYLGEAEVDVAYNFASDLSLPQDLPPRAFAVKAIQRPVVRILSLPSETQERLRHFGWVPRLGVEIVEHAKPPARPVNSWSTKDNLASFELVLQSGSWIKLKYVAPQHRLAETFPHPWPTKVIEWTNLLHHIGHFFHHLNRLEPNWDSDPPVEVAIVKVKDGQAIDDNQHRLGANGIEIFADETEYGFKVTNKSDQAIFFSLFYFDMSKFSIAAMYNPPTVAEGEASPCLEAHESKTIGYGDGDEAYNFDLAKAQTNDLGYLKLFYSDRYLDLLSIKRDPLFLSQEDEGYSNLRGIKPSRAKHSSPRYYMPADSSTRRLAALKIPIIQTRRTD